MLVIFAGASLAAGRVWRFPFDDEVYTMVPALAGVPRASTWDLVRFYLRGGDIHPPLTFLFFASLYDAGVSEAALHLISAAMTALSLALWQLLALAMVARGSPQPLGVVSRLIAVLLFGLSPLAIGQAMPSAGIRNSPSASRCSPRSISPRRPPEHGSLQP
jgi:hypothetical protein